MSDDENPAAKLRLSAMNSLARREHSRTELERKLAAKFPDHQALIPGVMERLTEQGLQSDERYVESFCQSRISRGQGFARIRNELRQRGVAEQLAVDVLNRLEVDWFDLARSVARRRFGAVRAESNREIAKRIRFLRYRGFNQEQINHALESAGADDE